MKFSGKVFQWSEEQMIKFWWQSGSGIWLWIQICIATLERHALAEVCYIFATKARIDSLKKLVKQQYLLQMSAQYGELRPPAAEIDPVVQAPLKFQRVSRLGSVTALHSSSWRQPNFAALNRVRHLYSARQPSRWALAHISSYSCYFC